VAVRELGELGLSAAPAIVQALAKARGAARRALLGLAARLSSPDIDEVFEKILGGRDRDEALVAAELLAEHGRLASPRLTTTLERRLTEELSHHARLSETLELFEDNPEAELLMGALNGARDRCTLAILSLLALLHDPQLRSMWRRLQLGHVESLGLSLEYLESVLPPELVTRVRRVFDPEVSGAHADKELKKRARDRMLELIHGTLPWLTPWIRAAAAEVARARGTGTLPMAPVVERVLALRRAPPFRFAPSESLAALAGHSQERALAPGEVLLERGAVSSSLLIVLEGALATEWGPTVEAGGSVGLYSALRPGESQARITATLPSRVLEVNGDDLQALVRDDFTFTWKVLLALCEVLRPGGAVAMPPRPAQPSGSSPKAPSSPVERVLAFSGAELFRGLDEGVLAALSAVADERCYAEGEPLMREGELGTSMFLLAEGRVRVEREGKSLARLEAPEVIGELAALAPAPRAASVVADRPARALILERDVFFELLRSHPEVVLRVLDLLVRRVMGQLRPTAAPLDPTSVPLDPTLVPIDPTLAPSAPTSLAS
jgi:CRP-like cAMP-binding protein